MCGRFTLNSNLDALQLRFGFEARDLDYRPRYNIAPTQPVLAVVNDGGRRAEFMRWGLIPFWAKDASIGSRMINARAETVAQKPAFRNSLRQRRCLILADGYYEWRKEEKGKTPMYIAAKTNEPFAMAGLFDTWKSPEGELIRSCAIITTSPNSLMEPIHNRMPVILSKDAETIWLDPAIENTGDLLPLLTPCPADGFQAHAVSTLVNSAKNDFPECIMAAG